MPFLTYECKGNAATNNGPHKTVVFVPAANLGSNSPGAVITCPRCTFTAQAGDGNMSSIGNGQDSVHQEKSLVNQSGGSTPANSPVALAVPSADSGIRIPVNSPGDAGGKNSQVLGVTVPRLDSAGFKNLF